MKPELVLTCKVSLCVHKIVLNEILCIVGHVIFQEKKCKQRVTSKKYSLTYCIIAAEI